MPRLIWTLVLSTVIIGSICAQDLKLPVWQEEIPGYIPTDLKEIREVGEWGVPVANQISKPTLEVYFPAQKNGAAILICPGGGYEFLAYQHEGKEIAEWLNEHGITAIVIFNRLPDARMMDNPTEAPSLDAMQAMRVIRENADSWDIDPRRVGVIGFSAGGHLAATLSTLYTDPIVRPDFTMLIYPVITMDTSFTNMYSRENLLGKDPTEKLVELYSIEQQVSEKTPPAFLVTTADDNPVPAKNALSYYQALLENNILSSELFSGQNGGHGYGLAKKETSNISQWPNLCIGWLTQNGWLIEKN